jgi:hypothetical protein
VCTRESYTTTYYYKNNSRSRSQTYLLDFGHGIAFRIVVSPRLTLMRSSEI